MKATHRRILPGIVLLMFLFPSCGGGDSPGDSGSPDLPADAQVVDLLVDDSDVLTPGDLPSDQPKPGDISGDVGKDLATPEDPGGTDVQEETGPCTVPPPLAEWTNFTVLGLEADDPENPQLTGVFEEAVVTSIQYTSPGGAKNQDVLFTLSGRAGTVSVNSSLPFNYEIPVALGQRVWLFARHEQGFEHRDLVFAVWDVPFGGTEGTPIFFLHDAARTGDPPWHECNKKNPCPSAIQVYTDCPPVPVECGATQYPPLELRMHGGLSSGEAVKPLAQGTTVVGFEGHRYINIRSQHYTDMFCMDLPGDWTAAAIGKSVYASQCECHDSTDCAAHEICEPVSHRCVPDRCSPASLNAAGKNCKEGWICDPFKGTCKQPIPPPDACGPDKSCGGDQVCNPEIRFCQGINDCQQIMGGCVANDCVVMDCLAGCNALLGACTECLADCQCAQSLSGDFCDKDHTCQPCDKKKIGFGQENPSLFELVHLCVWQNGVDPEILLQEIDPSITCSDTGGGPAGCDMASERSCSGSLEFVPGTKWISDDKWGRLCAISKEAWVPKIAGGHYL